MLDDGRMTWATFEAATPTAVVTRAARRDSDSDSSNDESGWSSSVGTEDEGDDDDPRTEPDYENMESTAAKCSNRRLRHAIRKTVRQINTNHPLHNLCIRPGYQHPAPLDGWIFHLPDARRTHPTTSQELHDVHHSPVKFGIFCPWTYFPSMVPANLKCPHCNCSSTSDAPIWAKGFTGGMRYVHAITTHYPIVVRRLRHMHCPCARIVTEATEDKMAVRRKERDFTALRVLDQFSGLRDHPMGFLVRGRTCIEFEVLDLAVALRPDGVSISTICKAIKDCKGTHYWRCHKSYLEAAVKFRIGPLFNKDEPITPFGSMVATVPFLGEGTLADIWRKDCARRKELEMMFITSLVGNILCSDHTFWHIKNVRLNHQTLYNALFAIMNEHGQVLYWAYTKTKSYTELARALSMLQGRWKKHGENGPRYWYVDNPLEVKHFLKTGHGAPIESEFKGFDSLDGVLKDPFHVMNDLSSTFNKKHPLYDKCRGEFRDAFFTTDEKNKQWWTDYLVSNQKYTAAEVAGWTAAFWAKRCKRHMMPLGDAGAKQNKMDELKDIVARYSLRRFDGKGLFTDDSFEKVGNIILMVEQDMLGDPLGETLYFDLEPDGDGPPQLSQPGGRRNLKFFGGCSSVRVLARI